jgi:hypothetical protein
LRVDRAALISLNLLTDTAGNSLDDTITCPQNDRDEQQGHKSK